MVIRCVCGCAGVCPLYMGVSWLIGYLADRIGCHQRCDYHDTINKWKLFLHFSRFPSFIHLVFLSVGFIWFCFVFLLFYLTQTQLASDGAHSLWVAVDILSFVSRVSNDSGDALSGSSCLIPTVEKCKRETEKESDFWKVSIPSSYIRCIIVTRYL